MNQEETALIHAAMQQIPNTIKTAYVIIYDPCGLVMSLLDRDTGEALRGPVVIIHEADDFFEMEAMRKRDYRTKPRQ